VSLNNPGYNDPTNPPPPHLRPEGPAIAGRIEPVAPPSDGPLPPALTAGPSFGGLMRGLRRRWMTAVALGVPLAILAVTAAWYLLAPRYTAMAQVRVLFTDPKGDIFGGGRDTAISVFNTLIKTTAGAIKSRPVINDALKTEAVRRLNLESKYGDVAAWLDEELKVETSDGNELITVTLSSNDPDEAVAIVRAITNTFRDRNLYLEKEDRKKKLADLQATHTRKVQELVKKKDTLAAKASLLSPEGKEKLLAMQQDLYDLRHQRASLKLEITKAESTLDFLRNNDDPKEVQKAVTDAMLDAEVERDTMGAKSLKMRIEKLENHARDFESSGDTRSPTYYAIRQQTVELKKSLAARRKELRVALEEKIKNGPMTSNQPQLTKKYLENTILKMGDQVKGIETEIKDLVARTEVLIKLPAEVEAAYNEQKSTEVVVGSLKEQIDKMAVELNAPDRIFVYQDAELQKKDVKKQLLGAIVAPIGVLALVCFVVALGEHQQRRIHNAGEVARGLGIRVVGAVPNLPHLEHHLVGANGDSDLEGHPALESIDALRTVLLREAGADGGRVVLVTSAVAGEGKTTLASHLAGSLARAGRKTLLIDGDLRRPAVHQLFEVQMQPGFSEVLLAEVEAEDAIQPTTIDGLSVMPAGQWDRTVLQALARDGIEGVFEKLRQEFDFLIVDSHPVLAATDSLLLAQRVDGVILSVLNTISQMPQVYSASQRLSGLGVRVLGAVVNASDPNEVYTSGPSATPAAA
jgi:capsular exopolysaccharide synthesis family protein